MRGAMATSLKELTQKHHDMAEQSRFAGMLIGGDITPVAYQYYLKSQYEIYRVLEERVHLAQELTGVFRAEKILADLCELEESYNLTWISENLRSVDEYIDHILNLEDNDDLMAHLYVRHFGDMHGGQIIKKRVPGSGSMYEFENRRELISGIRELLYDDMVDEAIICFQYATKLFEELDTLFATTD
tara:strand:- start:2709 stop:3269 length:561 start_codon:yes stop_codon:yes gene_type:complete